MTGYRAYQVGLDGHFAGFEPLVCADDTEATEKAQRLGTTLRFERQALRYPVGARPQRGSS